MIFFNNAFSKFYKPLICDSIYFMQIYKLAANNIYDNTREVVPKDTLRTLVHKMLEEVRNIEFIY